MTTRSRSHTAPTEAIIAASAVAPRWNARSATGSPAAPRRPAPRRRRRAGRPSRWPRAHRAIHGPAATVSTQPRPPHEHGSPSEFDDDVADVTGIAGPPVIRRAVEHQPAAHAGGHHHAEQEARRRGPRRANARRAPCTRRRRPAAPARRAPRPRPGRAAESRARQAILIGLTVPAARSMGPAEAIPTARTAPSAAVHRVGDHRGDARPRHASASLAFRRGLGSRCAPASPPWSTSPAAILVPPMSRARVSIGISAGGCCRVGAGRRDARSRVPAAPARRRRWSSHTRKARRRAAARRCSAIVGRTCASGGAVTAGARQPWRSGHDAANRSGFRAW